MNKPLLHVLTLLFIGSLALQAQTPAYHWLTKSDGERNDRYSYEADNTFLVDRQGNSYQLERINVQIDYGDTILYSDNDEVGAYALAKYNRNGQLQWAHKLVGLDDGAESKYWGWINTLSLDEQDNLILCGEFESTHFALGGKDTLQNRCPQDFCNTIFLAKISPQGKVLSTEQHYGYGDVQYENDYFGVTSAVMRQDGKGLPWMALNVWADTLVLDSQKIPFDPETFHTLLVHREGNGQTKIQSVLEVEGGGFYPESIFPQADGSILLFGIADAATTLKDTLGFSYTTAGKKDQYSLEDFFLLINYNSEGQIQWIRELHSDDAIAQLLADSVGNVYLLGYFEGFLKWNQKPLQSQADDHGGFIFKLDKKGDFLWQKIYNNGIADISLSKQVASISPDGGLLAPLLIFDLEGETSTIFEGREVQFVWDEYTSAIGHYSPLGVLDTFVPLPAAGEGIFFVTDLRFAPGGKLYGLFQTSEVDTLRLGNYALPVVDETSKILACFTLSNLPPGLTAPKLPTAIGKENLRMIRTYPNPSDQKLLVEWVPQQEASTLVLRNTAGQALRTAAMPPLASQHDFDLSELPAGWYLVEWQSGGKREVAKIVKK